MRPATASSRRRSRLGSQRRADCPATATSAAQSPPRATAIARSVNTLARSCTARGARHRANPADKGLPSPEQTR